MGVGFGVSCASSYSQYHRRLPVMCKIEDFQPHICRHAAMSHYDDNGLSPLQIADYPEFLNLPDREINQHIRIVYSTVLKKECEKSKGVGKFLFSFHHSNANKKVKQDSNGPSFWRRKDSRSPDKSSLRSHQENGMPFKDSTPCPSDFPSEIPVRVDGNRNEIRSGNSLLASPIHSSCSLEKEESELHLYVISGTSSIFLHLKSSWNNYIIRATLSQESPSSSEHCHIIGNPKPYRSEEKIKHFSQLKSELFLQDNTLREILCVVTELRVAAQKNFILKRLFWKTSELFYFLVNKLHEYLPESRNKTTLHNKSQRVNELAACIEIIQTLGLMFRETEIESSRLSTLAAKKGTLFNLLVILISKPNVPKSCFLFNAQQPSDSTSAEMSFDAQLQKLILEYMDKATALFYEILLAFQQGNLGLGSTKLAVSWMMSSLQSCPPMMVFVASIIKQVVDGLSASLQLLTPCQAVLLYQRLYILKSCLQYSKALAERIRNDHSEEFRYFICMPALEKRLPVWYPITEPTTQLCHEVLQLINMQNVRGD
ncbi:uncharacterized protein C12orf56 homolog isoform X1 [Cricetulus griseus]|uniref:uncharacterized protein C12orf56 homolog isoform X1 n=1 Tax=Cricetulus griseus TaxID=10029 RepID=UPI00022F428F|nr:uncharacterized protein C12orf56 homolog isoform X1 [Cricetulus griseus]